MSERKLATIRRIEDISPIENSDFLEVATVGGWKVVVNKDQYKAGDLAVYFEVDSFVPHTLAPFLTKSGHHPKEYEGVQGERLRTIKLRGQLSQGLLLPLNTLAGKLHGDVTEYEGTDVTELLGIKKWEKPIPAQLAGQIKGNFPSFLRKTDQERVQNLKKEIEKAQGEEFEVTLKLDGSSMTVYVNGDDYGVCSRNIDLKEDEGNAFWDMARKFNIHTLIRSTGRNLAIQGELIGPGIQKNYEKVSENEFHVFDIFDIDQKRYLLPGERYDMMYVHFRTLNHVRSINFGGIFILDHTIDELLQLAEGPGMNPGVKREGLVFKSLTRDFSFKAISNSYLLKEE